MNPMNSLRKMNTFNAFGSGVLTALNLLDAHQPDAARAVLSALHMAYIIHLRDEVAHEPGGVLAKKTPRSSGKGKKLRK